MRLCFRGSKEQRNRRKDAMRLSRSSGYLYFMGSMNLITERATKKGGRIYRQPRPWIVLQRGAVNVDQKSGNPDHNSNTRQFCLATQFTGLHDSCSQGPGWNWHLCFRPPMDNKGGGVLVLTVPAPRTDPGFIFSKPSHGSPLRYTDACFSDSSLTSLFSSPWL